MSCNSQLCISSSSLSEDKSISNTSKSSDEILGHYIFNKMTNPLINKCNYEIFCQNYLNNIKSYDTCFIHSDIPLNHALSNDCYMNPLYNIIAIKISKLICAYLTTYYLKIKLSNQQIVTHIIDISQISQSLIDEVYLQLVKHLIKNSNIDALIRAWTFLTLYTYHYYPSAHILPFIVSHIENGYDGFGCIKTIAPYCLWRLNKTIRQENNPNVTVTLYDIEQLRLGRISSNFITFGGSTIEYLLHLEHLEQKADIKKVPYIITLILNNIKHIIKSDYNLLKEIILIDFKKLKHNKQTIYLQCLNKLKNDYQLAKYQSFSSGLLGFVGYPMYGLLLQQFLSSLSQPLFCHILYFKLMKIDILTEDNVLNLISELPTSHFNLFHLLMKIFASIVLYDENTLPQICHIYYHIIFRCPLKMDINDQQQIQKTKQFLSMSIQIYTKKIQV